MCSTVLSIRGAGVEHGVIGTGAMSNLSGWVSSRRNVPGNFPGSLTEII